VHRGTEPVEVEQRFGREDSGYADFVIHGRHRRPPRFAGKATVIPTLLRQGRWHPTRHG
jgi:hypothetical protein